MNQLSMFNARGAANVGIQRAADATERRCDGWQELAVEALRQFARKQFDAFTIEAARVQIAATLPAPKNLKAWGAVTQRALALGFIVHREGEYGPCASSNCSIKRKYRAGEN